MSFRERVQLKVGYPETWLVPFPSKPAQSLPDSFIVAVDSEHTKPGFRESHGMPTGTHRDIQRRRPRTEDWTKIAQTAQNEW